MPSLFDGTDPLICDALRIKARKHLNHKSATLEPLSDKTAFLLVRRLYNRIADNSQGQARPTSEKLWSCRRATCIRDDNVSPEKTLEKAVAILALQGHMPHWFNQCPVATGIVDPHSDRKRSVDLIHLRRHVLRLVELKWWNKRRSDTPPFALFEVLEYGLAYLLARLHKRELGLEARCLMQDSVHHVRLEVVGQSEFFGDNSRQRDLFSRMHNALARFANEQTNGGWSMSLQALVFPDCFDAPFDSGKAVKEACAHRALSPEGRAVRDAFANLAPLPPGRFLPGVPGPDVERILDAAPGRELETKFDRPTSSAALAVNTFGFFLHRPADLPPLPGLNSAGWPARSLALERTIRFPWTGGTHPVPDCLVATGTALIGIECKRFEPFRDEDYTGFTDTFWRPVWGDRMVGYQRVRDLVRSNKNLYAFLDAAQLVKHALALRTAVQPRKEYHGLAPILLYVYAEPDVWPCTEREVHEDAKARHREDIASFANHVRGDEVTFNACSYRQLLDIWRRGPDQGIARHAVAVTDRFAP